MQTIKTAYIRERELECFDRAIEEYLRNGYRITTIHAVGDFLNGYCFMAIAEKVVEPNQGNKTC